MTNRLGPAMGGHPSVKTSAGKALYRITEAMGLLSMSRTVIYQEMRAGRLRYVRQGSDRRITAAAITEYVALLERETAQGVAA